MAKVHDFFASESGEWSEDEKRKAAALADKKKESKKVDAKPAEKKAVSKKAVPKKAAKKAKKVTPGKNAVKKLLEDIAEDMTEGTAKDIVKDMSKGAEGAEGAENKEKKPAKKAATLRKPKKQEPKLMDGWAYDFHQKGPVIAKVPTNNQRIQIHVRVLMDPKGQGEPHIDVRNYVEFQVFTGYSPKGIQVPLKHAEKLVKGIKEAASKA